MSFHFRLLSPERTLYDKDVEAITLPTQQGHIGILEHHVPMAAVLIPGIIEVKAKDGDEEIAVSSGFIEVGQKGTVTVLADTAERGHELDLSTIEAAKARAEQVMKQIANKDDVSFALAAAAVERELARMKVAIKYKSKHKNTAD